MNKHILFSIVFAWSSLLLQGSDEHDVSPRQISVSSSNGPDKFSTSFTSRRRARSADLSLDGTSQKQYQLHQDCVLAGRLFEICKRNGLADPNELEKALPDYKDARLKMQDILKASGPQAKDSSEEPQTLVDGLNRVRDRQSASTSRENSMGRILRDGAAFAFAGFAGLQLLKLGLHNVADRL